MGCSYDHLGVTIHRKEDIKTFVEIYNRELEDFLYYGKDDFISENYFEETDDGFSMSYEQEPLFDFMDQGGCYENMLLTYLKAVPNAPLSAWYECSYDNCDEFDSNTYNYSDGVIKIESRNFENSSLDYCPTCDWNAYEDDVYTNVVCTAYEYEPDKEYSCPKCGASLEFDVRIFHKTLKLVDGNWVKEDDK